MKSDIEIANEVTMDPITEIADRIGLSEDDIELYGRYKAKLTREALENLEKSNHTGRLILVTAMNPTAAGEGKSTVSVGLGDAFHQLNKKVMLALREPSLGPVMGIKGGATGGGYSQVVPMDDINLHFTGDIHAITTANNALAALIDNHIQQGNELDIDVRRITWKRSLDMNDRALRHIVVGLGGPVQGVPREDGFDISVASEIMAVLCLSRDLKDLKNRLNRIVIGYTRHQKPVTVADLQVGGALALLLKDAIRPNLVQTLEHTPTFIHGGPFANIAHGTNSIIATNAALKLADYVVTEAGFGADLGAEKFMDIVVPHLEKSPDATVIVATTRALKLNGGVEKELVQEPNMDALQKGFANLQKHIESMQSYQVPVVVAINRFENDGDEEIQAIIDRCQELGVKAVEATVWRDGGRGGIALAEAVMDAIEERELPFCPLYSEQNTLIEKMNHIVRVIYGGRGVVLTSQAKKQLQQIEENGWGHLPVCMAKTQYSLSDDATAFGRPTDFDITVRQLQPKTGAGFIVALTGDIMTMPGLPKKPAALNMDVDENGQAKGLF